MTICPETARLTALREGWLDEEDARSLREHLEVCPECRAARDDLDAILEAIDISRLVEVEPPPGGYEALLAATMKMRDRIIPVAPPIRNGWRRAILAAAAVVLITLTSVTLLDSPSPPDPAMVEAVEEEGVPEYLYEEHARASDLLPFSDSTTLMILANSRRR